MKVIDAMIILGVKEGYTAEQVRMAAARTMRAIHPDTRAPDMAPKYTLAHVKEARDCLLRECDRRDNPCRMCRGRGWLPYKLGVVTCSQCGGSRVAS